MLFDVGDLVAHHGRQFVDAGGAGDCLAVYWGDYGGEKLSEVIKV